MSQVRRITDPADPRVADYLQVRERDLVGREGRFVAEGVVVLEKYLNYAGLTIDTAPKTVEGAWHGIKASVVKDSLRVRDVDWNSPAWYEGIRRNQVITSINGQPASLELLNQLVTQNKPNDRITIETVDRGKKKIIPMLLGQKTEANFEIKRLPSPNELQKTILKSWLKE